MIISWTDTLKTLETKLSWFCIVRYGAITVLLPSLALEV